MDEPIFPGATAQCFRLTSQTAKFWHNCHNGLPAKANLWGAKASYVVLPSLVFVVGLPAMAVSGYLGFMGCAASPKRGNLASNPAEARRLHFTFVVPAHNEAQGIGRTVESLRAVEYPDAKFSVLVVADNCADDTKDRAMAAGARVLERHDSHHRGKGYALEYAFETLMSEGTSDAIVVVDADTDVSTNILEAIEDRILQGERVLQAHYGVRNAEDSWRTRLMEFAFTLYHGVRSTARERLSLSTGLRGNGMAFTMDALRRVPYKSYSLVEDVEYGIELGLNGIRVAYVTDTVVRGEMVGGGAASESQRLRWEQGRQGLVRRYAAQLLFRAVSERSPLLFDLALDILTPPLTTIVVFSTVGSVVALAMVVTGTTGFWVLAPWTIACVSLVTYIARGVQMSPQGPRVLLDFVHIPKYVAWKIFLRLRGASAKSNAWVRTARKGETT